jgi:NifU-like protein involved in Fe-S cluster formation
MNARAPADRGPALYTPDILALAVELAAYPLSDALELRGEAHSRVCGSRVVIGLTSGPDGAIENAGARVSACAIGQAAAALFLRGCLRQDEAGIAAALGDIEAWLDGGEAMPTWPDLARIAPARAYPARHAAILLPWKAAMAALSNPAAAD